MKSKETKTGSEDLFKSRFDQIINMNHELVELPNRIDWYSLDSELGLLYPETGGPAILHRMMVGLSTSSNICTDRPVNPYVTADCPNQCRKEK